VLFTVPLKFLSGSGIGSGYMKKYAFWSLY